MRKQFKLLANTSIKKKQKTAKNFTNFKKSPLVLTIKKIKKFYHQQKRHKEQQIKNRVLKKTIKKSEQKVLKKILKRRRYKKDKKKLHTLTEHIFRILLSLKQLPFVC